MDFYGPIWLLILKHEILYINVDTVKFSKTIFLINVQKFRADLKYITILIRNIINIFTLIFFPKNWPISNVI